MISIIFLLPQLIYSIKRALKLQGKTGNAAFCRDFVLQKHVSCFFNVSSFVDQTGLL